MDQGNFKGGIWALSLEDSYKMLLVKKKEQLVGGSTLGWWVWEGHEIENRKEVLLTRG